MDKWKKFRKFGIDWTSGNDGQRYTYRYIIIPKSVKKTESNLGPTLNLKCDLIKDPRVSKGLKHYIRMFMNHRHQQPRI